MGFFGGDNNDAHNESNDLLDKQMQQNAQEIELKRKNLYDTRLGIIKSTGGENWTPEKLPGGK